MSKDGALFHFDHSHAGGETLGVTADEASVPNSSRKGHPALTCKNGCRIVMPRIELKWISELFRKLLPQIRHP